VVHLAPSDEARERSDLVSRHCDLYGAMRRRAARSCVRVSQRPGHGRRTGEEIAAEEVGGEDLAVIHGDDRRHIVGIPGLASLMLDRIERGRLAAVNELLARHGVSQASQPVMLRYPE
jgi:hypothetical protein